MISAQILGDIFETTKEKHKKILRESNLYKKEAGLGGGRSLLIDWIECGSIVVSEYKWSVAHAARGGDGRQESCERGYYYLHRNLQNPLLHNSSFLHLPSSIT